METNKKGGLYQDSNKCFQFYCSIIHAFRSFSKLFLVIFDLPINQYFPIRPSLYLYQLSSVIILNNSSCIDRQQKFSTFNHFMVQFCSQFTPRISTAIGAYIIFILVSNVLIASLKCVYQHRIAHVRLCKSAKKPLKPKPDAYTIYSILKGVAVSAIQVIFVSSIERTLVNASISQYWNDRKGKSRNRPIINTDDEQLSA